MGSATGDAGPFAPAATGGLWASCHAGFRALSEPRRDVTRLGLLCGPSNGMSLLDAGTWQGELGADHASARHSFPAQRGECYRIVAVGDGGVTDLALVVRSSRGSRLASARSTNRWAVLHPDRPLCTFDDDEFAVEIHARRGAGHYAAQVWRLPASRGGDVTH